MFPRDKRGKRLVRLAESANASAKTAAELLGSHKDSMTRLLRAYVCVNFGQAIFQNPEAKLKFEAQVQWCN